VSEWKTGVGPVEIKEEAVLAYVMRIPLTIAYNPFTIAYNSTYWTFIMEQYKKGAWKGQCRAEKGTHGPWQ
jgi:hypothetical protein